MGSPVVLLPPSEGKSAGGRRGHSPDRFAAELCKPRAAVLEALAKVMSAANESEKSKLLRVRGDLLERAVVATELLIDGAAPLLPAWKRYSGVVWDALDPSTLAPTVRARILVPSGLYGITSAQDYIADYRLGMQSNLPGVGNLARFWRPILTDLIRPRRRGTTVIDLLTAEHRSAIEWQRFGPVVRIDFVEAQGRGAAGHIAKSAKGRFARHVIDHGIDEALSFTHEGWKVLRTESGFQIRGLK
jgi:cytoplasmic iron level regulating protein YaaA (DUF328/UPF0246 family)